MPRVLAAFTSFWSTVRCLALPLDWAHTDAVTHTHTTDSDHLGRQTLPPPPSKRLERLPEHPERGTWNPVAAVWGPETSAGR